MRILGLDPGSRVTGFAVLEAQGARLQARSFGAIRPDSAELVAKLGQIFKGVVEVIAETQPTVVAVESVFMARNPQSAIKLGQARGAVICAVAQAGLPLFEYSPRSIKQAAVGSGRADKVQVQHMMRQLLKIEGPLGADAADALAIAVCHAHTAQMQQHVRVADGRR